MAIGRWFLNFGLIASLMLSHYACATSLRLVIPQFPPYTSEEKGIFSGIGINLIDRVMKDIGIDYQLRVTPNYARALGEVVRGQADGFFLASENEQRNEVAVFSEPLLINHWSWFFAPNKQLDPTSNSFKSTANVATIHGSNTHVWLTKQGYQSITKSNSGYMFPRLLLEKKRIDAVFLASVVFRKELEFYGYKSSDYVEVVEKSKPFGIYISKEYLKKYPDFMSKLNNAIIKIQKLD
ncbi:hypothetical protein CW745_09915 [Psychromonas sp. psych-6C06]|uniref:substrate-binding periplasmic protein n=1 Tax=Psychromonas sp. psych-6C06 TaxID=2058089 RepID=UPI000C33981F|nr:transporter substrate-binding domain-containing protein [Psychromonas sp. psych-6C06]PKF61631.1 hypothetical protein CW745_09915 [Psychromonas sp. psych-6C06]